MSSTTQAACSSSSNVASCRCNASIRSWLWTVCTGDCQSYLMSEFCSWSNAVMSKRTNHLTQWSCTSVHWYICTVKVTQVRFTVVWGLRSSGMWGSIGSIAGLWHFRTVYQSISRGPADLEDRTNRLSWNVRNQLPIYVRRAKASPTPQHKPEIS
jgi:hypothetical protein